MNNVTGIREFDLGSISKVATQVVWEDSNSTNGGDGVDPPCFSRENNYLCQTAVVCSVSPTGCKKSHHSGDCQFLHSQFKFCLGSS